MNDCYFILCGFIFFQLRSTYCLYDKKKNFVINFKKSNIYFEELHFWPRAQLYLLSSSFPFCHACQGAKNSILLPEIPAINNIIAYDWHHFLLLFLQCCVPSFFFHAVNLICCKSSQKFSGTLTAITETLCSLGRPFQVCPLLPSPTLQ